MGNNPIAVFENGELHLNVRVDQANDTVWLTQEEMAQLFGVNRQAITKHISNIFRQKELDSMTTSSKMELLGDPNVTGKRIVGLYNLDVIIAVGYRVNSKKGLEFRHWASSILKSYLIQGYAINEKRLAELEKRVKIFEIATRQEGLSSEEKADFFDLLSDFEKGLILLDDYDHESFPKDEKGHKDTYVLRYEECRKLIDELPFSKTSDLFGRERSEGLFKGAIASIYQTFGGQDLYPTLEEKAAHLLYFLVKDHGFLDGNKRIAATLFVYFLAKNNALRVNGRLRIDDLSLAALTLLIAESKAEEKDLILSFTLGVITAAGEEKPRPFAS
jgi:prophage maintenance system killer protein/DNA-binding XRE family transcriptional regulator